MKNLLRVSDVRLEVIAGVEFHIQLGDCTVGDLRALLSQISEELSKFGPDDTEIAIGDVTRDRGIVVSFKQPIFT